MAYEIDPRTFTFDFVREPRLAMQRAMKNSFVYDDANGCLMYCIEDILRVIARRYSITLEVREDEEKDLTEEEELAWRTAQLENRLKYLREEQKMDDVQIEQLFWGAACMLNKDLDRLRTTYAMCTFCPLASHRQRTMINAAGFILSDPNVMKSLEANITLNAPNFPDTRGINHFLFWDVVDINNKRLVEMPEKWLARTEAEELQRPEHWVLIRLKVLTHTPDFKIELLYPNTYNDDAKEAIDAQLDDLLDSDYFCTCGANKRGIIRDWIRGLERLLNTFTERDLMDGNLFYKRDDPVQLLHDAACMWTCGLRGEQRTITYNSVRDSMAHMSVAKLRERMRMCTTFSGNNPEFQEFVRQRNIQEVVQLAMFTLPNEPNAMSIDTVMHGTNEQIVQTYERLYARKTQHPGLPGHMASVAFTNTMPQLSSVYIPTDRDLTESDTPYCEPSSLRGPSAMNTSGKKRGGKMPFRRRQ